MLRLYRKAKADLRQIGPGPALDRIESALTEIEDNAHDPASVAEQLQHTDLPIWSKHVGDHRILFVFDDEGPVVIRVSDRSDAAQAQERL